MTDNMDEMVMKLLHYFITEKGYSPVVLHGAKNEIWLENFTNDFGIVRIVTDNIYNDEQFNYDIFKTNKIAHKIKQKTFTFRLNILSIYLNIGENVNMENYYHLPKMECINIKEINDLDKFEVIKDNFNDITKNTDFKEEGMDLFIKLTGEIASTNEENNIKAEKIFRVKTPIITYSLVIINVLVFLSMYIFGNGSTDINTLVNFGAIYSPLIKAGEYYRLLFAGFIHIGIIHLFVNMYSLLAIGTRLESLIGKWKFLIVYLVSLIVGNLMSMLFIGNSISAGASGALFGLFGALLYFGYHYRVYLGSMMASQIIPILLINFSLPFFLSGIDLAAHIGGFVAGLLTLWALGVEYKSNRSDKINGLILLLMFVIFLVVLAFNIVK